MDRHHGWQQALEQRSSVLTLLSGPRGQRYIHSVFGDITQRSVEQGRRLPTDLMWEFLQRSLSTEVYYWAPDFVKVIADTFTDLPETTLTPDLLPAPAGYCYLDGIIPIPPFRDAHDGVVPDDIRAFSWCTIYDPTRPKESAYGLFVVLYTVAAPHLSTTPMPTTIYFWPINTTTKEMSDHDEQAREERVKKRLNAVVTAFLFLRQEVMVTSRRQPDRATRRRLKRASPGAGTEVKVVELRTRHYVHDRTDEPRSVEWSCRWLVRGHWRNQYYPSTEVHRPKWIQPYAKGPEDKPLRTPATTVFEVVR